MRTYRLNKSYVFIVFFITAVSLFSAACSTPPKTTDGSTTTDGKTTGDAGVTDTKKPTTLQSLTAPFREHVLWILIVLMLRSLCVYRGCANLNVHLMSIAGMQRRVSVTMAAVLFLHPSVWRIPTATMLPNLFV